MSDVKVDFHKYVTNLRKQGYGNKSTEKLLYTPSKPVQWGKKTLEPDMEFKIEKISVNASPRKLKF